MLIFFFKCITAFGRVVMFHFTLVDFFGIQTLCICFHLAKWLNFGILLCSYVHLGIGFVVVFHFMIVFMFVCSYFLWLCY